MKKLEIWGVQSKTEIGGFSMIGPVDSETRGCTAYVCNGADAKEIIHAVNCHDNLLQTLESITLSMKAHPDCTEDSEFADMVSIAEDAINKAKCL